MKHNRVINILTVIGLAALILMTNLTSPTAIGPIGVLLFFTTLYMVSFGVTTILVRVFLNLAFRKPNLKTKEYLYAAVLAFAPIMLLMARSFGAINLWTVGLIVLFLVLAEFLVYKRI